VFTGLKTKAGVHVTTSACIENIREEGGSTEHIRILTREGTLGRKVRIIDLETGELEDRKEFSETTIGEYVFWRCLEEVLGTPPEVLREAKLVMIREPGKARTVTKAHAALKVILDLVNGICSYPLKKGMESSESGMGKANHGWNFFMNLMGPWRDLAFDPLTMSRTQNSPESHLETTTYRDLFVSFTDYEEATDRMNHDVARAISELWMVKCGLPKILRGIVHETCYKPRTIFFHGTGCLEKIGEPVEDKLRKVLSRQGVLMGDPLTKVVLHLCNAGVRELGRINTQNSVLDGPLLGGTLKKLFTVECENSVRLTLNSLTTY